MQQRDMRKEIVRIVRQMGFSFSSYMGSDYLVDSVLLCLREPDALCAVTKRVYPTVARQAGVKKWKNVERNMRTAVEAFWQRGNREMLNQMAGFEIRVRPSVGEIIDYIVGYIQLREMGE